MKQGPVEGKSAVQQMSHQWFNSFLPLQPLNATSSCCQQWFPPNVQKPFFLMENSSPALGTGVFPAPLHVFSSEVGSFSSLCEGQGRGDVAVLYFKGISVVESCSNITKHNYLLSIAVPQQITLIGLSLSREDVESLLFSF